MCNNVVNANLSLSGYPFRGFFDGCSSANRESESESESACTNPPVTATATTGVAIEETTDAL